MAGIYAPIICIVTLTVLSVQVSLQRNINEHQYDQTYIQQARSDTDFYSSELASALNGVGLPGKTLRAILHENFRPNSAPELDNESLGTLAANIDDMAPNVLAIWSAIYPILMGLEVGKGAQFEMTLNGSLLKLNAMLTIETCASLDNYHPIFRSCP